MGGDLARAVVALQAVIDTNRVVLANLTWWAGNALSRRSQTSVGGVVARWASSLSTSDTVVVLWTLGRTSGG